jgi:hypothetical protein
MLATSVHRATIVAAVLLNRARAQQDHIVAVVFRNLHHAVPGTTVLLVQHRNPFARLDIFV